MQAAKQRQAYSCESCGATHAKWNGQCSACSEWNTLTEVVIEKNTQKRHGYAGMRSEILPLTDVDCQQDVRFSSELKELDYVLGGGLVKGAVILIGGDPGIGKSTLLLETLCRQSSQRKTLYITGEESLQQISSRANRLELDNNQLLLLAETHVEQIIAALEKTKPQVAVIDSIQTIYTALLSSAPGSVAQIRESAAKLVQFAKSTQTTLFLVGHVTKEGALAGPRVLEHMVDTVLYFEGQKESTYRLLRAVKNRFGAVNELGVFAMTDKGLKEVTNPSAIFLSRYQKPAPGSVVMVTWEGTRPLLVEVQALVDQSHLGNPRRVTVGLDANRLALILAVLHRHGRIATYDQDVFVNVVGGVKITETAIDLAIVAAVVSSLKHQPLPLDLILFGEVGLSGEIRPVKGGEARLKEAVKHGFKRAIIPKANAPKAALKCDIEVVAVTTVLEALEAL